jgi:heterodisulfide reductase subunit A
LETGKGFTIGELEKVRSHPNITILTNSDIQSLRKGKDNGRISVEILARTKRVDNEKCNDCKACIKVCPVNMYDDFDEGFTFRTAVDYCNPLTGEYNIYKEDMPVCQRTCPVNLDIRRYVGQIADGNHLAALATIRERLPFPFSIGRVCPHPCETACNRQYLDNPISICGLKRFVADFELSNNEKPKIEPPEAHYKEKVAVVGAGPSGLTCANDLARMGYSVKVFEALPVPGGMLYVGIPEYRLPKKILQREVDLISELGVEIEYNVRIGKDISLEELRKQYDAVYIAAGCHKGLKLRIPGEDDFEGVIDCVTFLRDVALGKLQKGSGRLIVIGGGNAAIDSARTAWRMGYDQVYILYRRTKKEMPANPWEIHEAELEGVDIQYLAAPVEILGGNGKVQGMKCIKMELGEPDASGRRRPVPKEGSEYIIEADVIVPAISQGVDMSLLSEGHEYKITRWETFQTDSQSGATNVSGVFAGGDVASGPDIAIRAIANGKQAAVGIHNYLRSK